MTTEKKVARRKLSLLELAQQLGNISKACQLMGYSRQQFYEIRRNFQTYGADGLLDRLPGARGPHPNRVSEEVEKAVLDHSLEHPTHGCLRVAQELALRGIQVSSGGVRGVWSRHGLLTKHERLLRLEKHVAERQVELNEEQTRLLERFSPEFRERQIEVRATGELVAVDTFVGTLKGVGRVSPAVGDRPFFRAMPGAALHQQLPMTAVQLSTTRCWRRLRPTALAPKRCSATMDGTSAAGPIVTPVSCAARRDRAPHDPGSAAPVQWLRRTAPPHAARRALPRHGSQEVLRIG